MKKAIETVKKNLISGITAAVLILFQSAGVQAAFVHPGLMHTQADLDRMAAKVAANAQPWTNGWIVLTANSHSSSTYTLQGPVSIVYRGYDGVNTENYSKLYNDIAAAYANALRWHISGNTAHAQKAVQIMNAWSSTLTAISGTSDKYLAAGIYGYEFANAAELMRSYSGWSAADFNQFKNMMLNIFYPMNHDFLVNHNGACISHYWANWDSCNIASILAIGVLCDRQDLYDEAVGYFKTGAGNGAIEHAFWVEHPGNLYQCQESGRDQGHCTLVISLLGAFCEMAWNQGDDMYGYDNGRFWKGCEYVAKYNLFYDVPYAAYNNCDNVNQTVIAESGRGAIRPTWEMIYNHYVNRMAWAAPFSQQFAGQIRPEGGGGNYGPNSGGYDQLGYGTLTCTLDTPSVGAPSNLTASPVDTQVSLSWTGSAGAISYNAKRSIISCGPYTTIATGITAASYTDTTAANGTTYYYVVSAVNAGGQSVDSAKASATPTSLIPSAPTGLTVVADVGQVNLSWNVSAGTAHYNVKRSTTSGGPYTTIASPTTASYTDTTVVSNTAYYYVISAENANGESPNSAQIYAGPVPIPWMNQDIGTVGLAGGAFYAGTAFTVKGAGSNIHGPDSFHFVYKSMSGNGEIIARIPSTVIAGTDDDKIGLMMRETLTDTSRHVMVLLDTKFDNARLATKTSTSGTSTWQDGPAITLPQWFKLKRVGNTFTGYVSTDDQTWTTVASSSVTMNSNIYVGMAVCSRNTDSLNTTIFDNVTAPGWTSVTPPEFLNDPFSKPQAIEGNPYSGSLASDASDVDPGDTLSFSKVSGPGWLNVASNGSLSGTPGNSDTGENVFTIQVQDQIGLSGTATMTIEVANIFSGSRGIDDLLGLAAQWLMRDCVDNPACNGADLDGDANVNLSDLAELARNWQTGP
jgi:regulation of enolase protein 1 (concanavalin A-like superfamily)